MVHRKKSEPAERVADSRQGWSRTAAEPLLIQKKNRNPQSGWQRTWLSIKNLASPFIYGNTIFLQENLKLFLRGILAVMLLLIDYIVYNGSFIGLTNGKCPVPLLPGKNTISSIQPFYPPTCIRLNSANQLCDTHRNG